jgi:hypothetical protein
MVRRPNLFKYLPIRLRIFNCWDAFFYKFLIYVYQNLDGNQRLCLKV